jgi:site-specific DNA recombinase
MPEEMKKLAALYARFSPRPATKVRTCVSIDMQLERMREYCRGPAGLTILHEFDEPETSASTPLVERPEGAKLLEALRSQQVNQVVAYAMDRLFRNQNEAIETIEKWHKVGIGVHILDWCGAGQLNTSTPHGYLILTITAAVAEYSRRDTAARTRAAAEYRQRTGTAMGNPPLGWRRVKRGETWILLPEPREQEALAYIKRRKAEGATYYKIVQECNELGFPARGKCWRHSTVKRALRRANRKIEPQPQE